MEKRQQNFPKTQFFVIFGKLSICFDQNTIISTCQTASHADGQVRSWDFPSGKKIALRVGELVPGEGSQQNALHRKACSICLIWFLFFVSYSQQELESTLSPAWRWRRLCAPIFALPRSGTGTMTLSPGLTTLIFFAAVSNIPRTGTWRHFFASARCCQILPSLLHRALWLPQVFNQALRQQCTCVGYVRSKQSDIPIATAGGPLTAQGHFILPPSGGLMSGSLNLPNPCNLSFTELHSTSYLAPP